MTFEVFTGRGGWQSKNPNPQVTLGVNRFFYANRAAYESLGQPSHVVLLYDKSNGGIALKAATSTTTHAYPVRKQPRAQSYLIAAIAFCKHHDINGLPRRFSAVAEDGMLVLTPQPTHQTGRLMT